MKTDKLTTSIIDGDSEMQRGVKVYRRFYDRAIEELGFDHNNATAYARDHFREWWKANVEAGNES